MYRPLVEGEKDSNLKLISPILGDFVYKLKLVAAATQNQKYGKISLIS